MKTVRFVLFSSLAFAVLFSAAYAQATPSAKPIETITIHPPFAADYACSEHWEGQLQYAGDALGTDCFVTALVDTPDGGAFSRAFRTDGLANEDWLGWGEPVLAPIDGKIAKIVVNETVNAPGQLGEPPATFVVFERADGAKVLIAHVAKITVKEGNTIKAGQPFAVVGNNGYARNPHVHIGAWDAEGPLQIRHDLRARGALMKAETGNRGG